MKTSLTVTLDDQGPHITGNITLLQIADKSY